MPFVCYQFLTYFGCSLQRQKYSITLHWGPQGFRRHRRISEGSKTWPCIHGCHGFWHGLLLFTANVPGNKFIVKPWKVSKMIYYMNKNVAKAYSKFIIGNLLVLLSFILLSLDLVLYLCYNIFHTTNWNCLTFYKSNWL